MRSANRNASRNQFLTFDTENFSSSIPLPPSPEVKQPPPQQEEEMKLPPLDLNKVTGKKILFESSDSEEDEEETTSEPQVPVSLSASEPRAVPDGFHQNQLPPLPMPSSSSSSATLDAIKTRVANLINIPNSSSSQINQSSSTTKVEDDDNEDEPPVVNPERNQAISAKFNRKRRKIKRNKKKKNANSQITQQITNENEPTIIDSEEAWKRHVAMQLQYSFLKGSNPILRALTAEAHKKLGISQEEINGKFEYLIYQSFIYLFSFKNFNSMMK
jgi:hypothetical protein